MPKNPEGPIRETEDNPEVRATLDKGIEDSANVYELWVQIDSLTLEDARTWFAMAYRTRRDYESLGHHVPDSHSFGATYIETRIRTRLELLIANDARTNGVGEDVDLDAYASRGNDPYSEYAWYEVRKLQRTIDEQDAVLTGQ